MKVKSTKTLGIGLGAALIIALVVHGCGGKPHEPLMQGYTGTTDAHDDVTKVLVFYKFDPTHAIFGLESRQMNIYTYVPIKYSSHGVKIFLESKKTLDLDISEDGYTLTCASCMKDSPKAFHVVTAWGAPLSSEVVDDVFNREKAMAV